MLFTERMPIQKTNPYVHTNNSFFFPQFQPDFLHYKLI